MWKTISGALEKISSDHQITILLACESGSRAWQFPSPDSDFDVRFIYVRPYKYYLSVSDRDYDLGFPINDELDIYGWDIRKVLQLVRKSNSTVFEWLQSPIIYAERDSFRNELWTLCQSFFSQRTNIHHYLGLARGMMQHLTTDNEIPIKKLFYIIRPLMAAKWCAGKNTIAPMTIAPLIALMPEELKAQVEELIFYKSSAVEKFVIRITPALRTYLEQEYEQILLSAVQIEKDYFPIESLDEFFINTITRYDNQRS
ncbi:MAG: nucleotidyltransferase domain-containing protein [Chitinophagaceae bacterium]